MREREHSIEFLNEKQLQNRKRQRGLDIAKGAGKVAWGIAKIPVDIIRALGRESAKNERLERGFRSKAKVGAGLREDKEQREHRRVVVDIVSRGTKIRIAQAKRNRTRENASRNRFR